MQYKRSRSSYTPPKRLFSPSLPTRTALLVLRSSLGSKNILHTARGCVKLQSKRTHGFPVCVLGTITMSSASQQLTDYDFVEKPSDEFFCPVTLELLQEPFLTVCCGNHLSKEAANQLQREQKPCPLCKEQLQAVPDKFFRRKVKELKVRCPKKVGGRIRHLGSAPGRRFVRGGVPVH